MKRLLICLGVLFIILRPLSAHTYSDSNKGVLDFTFVNNTGKTLFAFFVTETKDEDWGDDLLPEDLVETEDEVDVTFDDDDDGDCHWDVKVSLDDDDTKFWYVRGIDLCEVSKLTFFLEGGVCKFVTE